MGKKVSEKQIEKQIEKLVEGAIQTIDKRMIKKTKEKWVKSDWINLLKNYQKYGQKRDWKRVKIDQKTWMKMARVGKKIGIKYLESSVEVIGPLLFLFFIPSLNNLVEIRDYKFIKWLAA